MEIINLPPQTLLTMLKPFILMVISDYLKHQYKWDPLIIGFEGDIVCPGGNTNKKSKSYHPNDSWLIHEINMYTFKCIANLLSVTKQIPIKWKVPSSKYIYSILLQGYKSEDTNFGLYAPTPGPATFSPSTPPASCLGRVKVDLREVFFTFYLSFKCILDSHDIAVSVYHVRWDVPWVIGAFLDIWKVW